MKVIDLLMGEDIRHEVGNKYSLMGIWADSVTLNGTVYHYVTLAGHG